MTDKDLIKKLNSLKNIKPEAEWKTSNRDLLLSQISNSGAVNLSAWKIFSINFNSFIKAASQPAYALGVFVLLLIGGSLFSHEVLNSAKPNDSLYIARIISERAKLTTVLNTNDRNKLAVRFALEHAQDISNILADSSFNTEENKDQVARLNESFNEEIETAKNKISYLTPKKVIVEEDKNIIATETDLFLIAGNDKDNHGLQVVDNVENQKSELTIISPIKKTELVPATPSSTLTKANNEKASTTENSPEDIIVNAPLNISSSSNLITDSILNEAKQLSENKDYGKVSEKLREVGELIK